VIGTRVIRVDHSVCGERMDEAAPDETSQILRTGLAPGVEFLQPAAVTH
jgi:hypothetical protein